MKFTDQTRFFTYRPNILFWIKTTKKTKEITKETSNIKQGVCFLISFILMDWADWPDFNALKRFSFIISR